MEAVRAGLVVEVTVRFVKGVSKVTYSLGEQGSAGVGVYDGVRAFTHMG